jgi:hypothetical protein
LRKRAEAAFAKVALPGLGEEGKIHRVDPKFAS